MTGSLEQGRVNLFMFWHTVAFGRKVYFACQACLQREQSVGAASGHQKINLLRH